MSWVHSVNSDSYAALLWTVPCVVNNLASAAFQVCTDYAREFREFLVANKESYTNISIGLSGSQLVYLNFIMWLCAQQRRNGTVLYLPLWLRGVDFSLRGRAFEFLPILTRSNHFFFFERMAPCKSCLALRNRPAADSVPRSCVATGVWPLVMFELLLLLVSVLDSNDSPLSRGG